MSNYNELERAAKAALAALVALEKAVDDALDDDLDDQQSVRLREHSMYIVDATSAVGRLVAEIGDLDVYTSECE